MDTKWRKFRIILSFTAFFVGMTLLLNNFISMINLIGSSWDSLSARMGTDYQEQEDFRWYMSNRLEELLGVATGGKGWNSYGVTYSNGDIYYGNGYYNDGWWWETSTDVQEAEQAVGEEISEDIAAYAGEASSSDITYSDGYWRERQEEAGIYGDEYGYRKPDLDSYMKEYARDKNLRYAVLYKGKLLYTNMEQLETQVGEELKNTDFQSYLPQDEEYNFCLWFNDKGDGKVRINKDGQDLDVYGDGVYTEDSLWFVPGYTNFNVDETTREAVVFIAAAKKPKLYIAGNYSQYGSNQNWGGLYSLQQRQQYRYDQYQACKWKLLTALLLLTLAFLFRKDKRLGDQAIGRFLGHIWMEPKLLLFVGIPILFLLTGGREMLRELIWILEDEAYLGIEELSYYAGMFITRGTFLTAVFWMIYLGAVDLRLNKGHRKFLFGPLVLSLRTRELKLPVQKRMVERYCQVLVPAVLSTVFTIAAAVSYENSYREWNSSALVMLLFAIFSWLWLLIFGTWHLRKNKQLAKDLGALSNQILEIREGNLTKRLELPEDADLKAAAENLNEIQQGMETALREQTKSERMKVELVANVSHDIKTPLTSIVSYVELLKQEEELPEHVKEYVQILGEKSERLKTMIQDVFEVSKAASNQLPVNMERLDLGKLLRQTLADMNTQIEESGLGLKTSIPEKPVMIFADGQRLYRVFQNLIQNALKYSLSGSRIFLTLTDDGKAAVASIKNISDMELDDAKDFTERFVRGDTSRTDGGSGLGLSIAKSFTEACGGSFRVETNADLFTVIVEFAVVFQ